VREASEWSRHAADPLASDARTLTTTRDGSSDVPRSSARRERLTPTAEVRDSGVAGLVWFE